MKVNLWFARDEQNEIVSIVDSTNENTYTCPICSSKVIPKALESKKVTPHYAHVDVDKCNAESMLHWWFKHKFIERGDAFKIKTDSEIEYICKDFDTEVTFQLDSGAYRPDLVVYTECGQEIVFEMANTNKKKVQDYIDKWIELDRIVVEVDIKALQSVDEIKVFNALYYNGKCFNFNKRDGGYYNTIGKLKEQMEQGGKYDIKLAKKLDWFWYEISKDNLSIDGLFEHISLLKQSEYDLFYKLFKSSKCKFHFNEFKDYVNKSIESRFEGSICDYLLLTLINKELTKNNITFLTRCDISKRPIKKFMHSYSQSLLYTLNEIDKYIELMIEIRDKQLLHDKSYMKFYKQLKKDDEIRNTLKIINKGIKKFGKVRLSRCSSKVFSGYYNKQKQYRVDYYYYSLTYEDDEGGFLYEIPLSKTIYTMNKELLINYITENYMLHYRKDD